MRREVVMVHGGGGSMRFVCCSLSVEVVDGRKRTGRIGSVAEESVEICERRE